jgi:hypothetical protein
MTAVVCVHSSAPAPRAQAYTVTDASGGAACWECGPGRVVRLPAAAAGGSGWLTHTNHALGGAPVGAAAPASESLDRLTAVDAALCGGAAPEAALCAVVKRGGGGGAAAANMGVTFAAVVARCPGSSVAFADGVALRAAAGAPPLPPAAWTHVAFDDDDERPTV